MSETRIAADLDHAVRLRMDDPHDDPYPATIGEVADEVVAWIRLMETAPAPGLGAEVLARLAPPSPEPAQEG